jgi:molecular chaperone GrpE (heat shock protein)
MWKFWQYQKLITDGLGKIAKGLDRLMARMDKLENTVDELNAANGQQENKLLRMQYKSSQEILGNLEDIKKSLSLAGQVKDNLHNEQKHKGLMLKCLLELLDDLDLVNAKVQGDEDDRWKDLCRCWSEKITGTLNEVGIVEIPLLGREFNPLYAEALGTVTKDVWEGRPTFAYQVVEVCKRGFVWADGSILRKGSVVTVEEEEVPAVSPSREDLSHPPYCKGAENRTSSFWLKITASNPRSNRLTLRQKIQESSCSSQKRRTAVSWKKQKRRVVEMNNNSSASRRTLA